MSDNYNSMNHDDSDDEGGYMNNMKRSHQNTKAFKLNAGKHTETLLNYVEGDKETLLVLKKNIQTSID